ncbi:MAG: hypothetical protein J6E38_05450 [Clostridia bacterium]|nr:hypothetical protein [Clostridia bacterium]
MSENKSYYKETVERYCHIIGRNTTFRRYTSSSEGRCFECENRDECEKNGGCKHHVFSKFNTKKEG